MNASGSRNASLIMLGTVVGQACTMLSMPLLSRLYTPAEMGYFTIFSALVGLFTTTAALHYELAIPLPASERRASQLTQLALGIVTVCAAVIGVALLVTGPRLLALANAGELEAVKYWLPASFFLGGITTVWGVYAIRRGRFARNALSKGLQGSVQAVAQTGLAFSGAGWPGLIAGQLLGSVAATLPLVDGRVWKTNRLFHGKMRRFAALLRKYRNFPLAAAPSSLINSAANNVPTLLLAVFFGAGVAGLYGLSVRVLQMPLRVVGQSIAQVFLGQAARARRDRSLPQQVAIVFQVLLKLSLHTFIPLTIIARPLFLVAFGPDWVEAGAYTQWLMPWLLISFVSTPLSMLVTVLEKQRAELALQIAYLVLITLALTLGWLMNHAGLAVAAMGCAGGVFLMAKIWWLLGIAGCDRASLLKATRQEVLAAGALHAPLALLLLMHAPALFSCVVGICWILAVHLINYRVRRIYAF